MDDGRFGRREFVGGERAAQERLRELLGETTSPRVGKDTDIHLRPESCSLQPWLAQGNLSARSVYWRIVLAEEQQGLLFEGLQRPTVGNLSNYALTWELRHRDFYRLFGESRAASIYEISGCGGPCVNKAWKQDEDAEDAFDVWAQGKTGVPVVDATMRQLNKTGHIGIRGRQYVAAYLCHTLDVYWRYGAEYFEENLLDYEPIATWAEWCTYAGVGGDGSPIIHFDPDAHCVTDADVAYIQEWCPEYSEEDIRKPPRDAREPKPPPTPPWRKERGSLRRGSKDTAAKAKAKAKSSPKKKGKADSPAGGGPKRASELVVARGSILPVPAEKLKKEATKAFSPPKR